jgi:GrpB-like predicted nucleotidyltransferase (UPF0157 family)
MSEIEIVEYRPEWIEMFEQATFELENAAPGLFVEFEHIGSTSVPGLAAKPIVDILAGVIHLSDVNSRVAIIESLGYELRDFGAPGRLYFARSIDEKDRHHLHIVEIATFESRKELSFRDWLRQHPEDVAAYAEVKEGTGCSETRSRDLYESEDRLYPTSL